MKRHVKIHSELQVNCDICNVTLTSLSLKRHKLDVHGLQMETYSCELCDTVFKYKSTLKTHKRQVHEKAIVENKTWTCDKCGKIFHRMCELSRHKQIHLGLEFECMKCNKKCKSQAQLDRHMSENHKHIFKCNFCERSFPRRYLLKTHVDGNHGPKVNCEICGLTLQNNTLKRHMKIVHSDTKPCVSCEVCGMDFKYSQSLKRHMFMKHPKEGDEGQYKVACDICQKQMRKDLLKRHKLIQHEQEAC